MSSSVAAMAATLAGSRGGRTIACNGPIRPLWSGIRAPDRVTDQTRNHHKPPSWSEVGLGRASSARVGTESYGWGGSMRRILFVCLLAVASAAVVPAVASAGTYVDYECAGPDGQPVPAAGF